MISTYDRTKKSATLATTAIVSACVLLLSGCEKSGGGSVTIPTVTGNAQVTQVTFTDTSVQLTYYVIDPDTAEKEEATTYVDSGTPLTAEYICDFMADTISDDIADVTVDSVTQDGDTVIVSFSSDTAPICGVSAKIETAILDSIAQTLVDNLDGCDRVIYRKEGEAYVSDNFSFDKDYIYLETGGAQ
jgi:hypothetical protein